MARNRQRAKDRQAQRRAERLKGAGGDGSPRAKKPSGDVDPILGGAPGVVGRDDENEELLREADLEVGAPPQDLGRSDDTLAHSPLKEGDEEDLEELEDYDFEDEEQPVDEPATTGPRGVRGGRQGAEEHPRNRLVAFLLASWAELQRVQWPDRRQVAQATAVVIGFVIIIGAYLGAADFVFSKLVDAII